VAIIDARRRYVLHPEIAKIGASIDATGLGSALGGAPSFRQRLSVATDFDEGDERMMGALSTIPSLGWAVVVKEPERHAYRTLHALRLAIAVAVLLAVGVSLLAGVFGGRRVVRPLEALVQVTQRLGRREWGAVPSALSDRGDEVGGLARAVDEMSSALEVSERELVQQTRARAALARYLPADVVDLVVKDPTRLGLGGERRLVTVLFADVVGFTRLAEVLAPEATVAVLNEYFALATEIVQRHHGIVDKFLGDCVMAVWGVPEHRDDDAKRALEAAQALRRWVEAANRRWREKYGVEVQLAMGLNTGLVVAGNVGSERRLEYTVVGDAVNVAARLEASAAPGQILVSQETRAASGAPSTLVELGERHLRGRTKAMTVFEVRTT
jgi:class 3 adenylate cyclase